MIVKVKKLQRICHLSSMCKILNDCLGEETGKPCEYLTVNDHNYYCTNGVVILGGIKSK